MPPVNVPVPGMESPVAVREKRLTPRMAMLNCPVPALYTPVLDSDAKYKAGADTVPLISPIEDDPARTVFAFTRLMESQINVDC